MANNDKNENVETGKLIALTVIAIIAIVLLVTTIFGSWYIVNAGERGIVVTLGKPEELASTEGFHWKAPILQRVVHVDIKTQKYEAKASAASKDLQTVSTDIAVNYHLEGGSVVRLYKEIGLDYGNRVIQPAVQEVVKASTAHYTAEELITKRAAVKEEIDTALRARLLDRGIVMETTSITNFDFSAQFNAAIEQKVTQEQLALTQKNKLAQVEYEAKQQVAAAQGKRDADIAAAEATAKLALLKAESEAKALEMQRNQVTEEVLDLRRIEVQMELAKHWNGAYPQYYMPGNTGVLPILDIPTTAVIAQK